MILIELLKAILFGIVEGITEWLPISSTGHLLLLQEFVNFKGVSAGFMDMFNVVIQLGAILAVVVIYFGKLNPFKPGKSQEEVKQTWSLWSKVLVAILPAMVIGVPLDDWFEAHFYNPVSIALMLIIYGIAFLVIEKQDFVKDPSVTRLEDLPYATAFKIGLFQVLALFPGTSRSGATIVGGLLNGTSRSVVTEFTFFLGIPVMFGASGVKVLKFILNGNSLTGTEGLLLAVAMVTAFAVSLYAIRFLTGYVKQNDFTIFGKYRIVLGILLLLYAGVRAFLA
ncbi:undecaprenyl-diphosphate phosphatase [Streptococcus danieliae]|uniref:Undecaprenyl-diphosphatase n=1 Tax=Streptococcus danieliae TaxID=747656 RepID=A0A7X3KBI9_9STRE|nr:undecaprenyl-diphosphate phosphatase [Streptococcus danieliae]MCU0081972.1 undecaprenyl-diphosphate phosphatase [Streptococcus danieliae]MVX58615.1 undecaprenyl-diphosphate phosphatase [Streptococcus danieliae]NYS32746.1 undecaprenyl-diphosphate phosphatase [Streptococcus danieliae]